MPRRASALTPRLVLALVILFLGVLFTLDNLRIVDADEVLYYWPAVFLLVGLAKLTSSYRRRVGCLWIAIGLFLLLPRVFPRWDLVDLVIDNWPVLLILAGLYLVVDALLGRRAPPPREARERGERGDDREINAFAFLGAVKRTSSSPDFRGGDLVAVMGGCELDLRGAAISEGEAVIDVIAFWGGVEIAVPASWTVDLRVLPVMGGAEDKTKPPSAPGGERLVVKGFAVMGGIEVHN